jgi:hypothetical protein
MSIFDTKKAFLFHFLRALSSLDQGDVANAAWRLTLGGCSPFVLVR